MSSTKRAKKLLKFTFKTFLNLLVNIFETF